MMYHNKHFKLVLLSNPIGILYYNLKVASVVDVIINGGFKYSPYSVVWRGGVAVISTTKLHSIKFELRFWAGLNLVSGVLEICGG